MAGMIDELVEAARQAAEASQNVARLAEEAAAAAPGAVNAAAEAGGHGGGISPFLFLLSVFVLACFVGYYVVWSVTPALHTPLMSVTNAVSSVIIVGALVAAGVDTEIASSWTPLFGFVATALASVNIFGGFMVTERMLAMYKKKD